MGTLSFITSPVWVPGDETVEVRPVCDGVDILGQMDRDAIGLYPPDFFAQSAVLTGGMLRLGICQCGCEGCGDVEIEVKQEDGYIVWTSKYPCISKQWHFDIANYNRAVSVAREDLSWERTADTIGRLLKLEDFSATLQHDLKFECGWMMADGRGVHLCFRESSNELQTREVLCPTYEPELAIAAVRAYIDKHFAN